MLYGFLLTLYLLNCFFLIIIILMQKGKSGLGLGGLGGGAQMLFGGSGGQDLFQKTTWVLGSIFMVGALILSLIKSTEHKKFKYVSPAKIITQQSMPQPSLPIENEEDMEDSEDSE